MLHIALILHSARSENLGVGALTVSQVDILRRLAASIGTELKITLLDWADPGAPCVSGPDIETVALTGIDLLSPSGAYRRIRDADLVLDIGAGDSFADIYGGKRLRRILWLKMLCHLAGRRLVLAPQTFGPFRKPLSRRLAAASISRSALVCARDEASALHLRDIGVTGEVITASDVALRLPGAAECPREGPPRIGINVSGLLMAGGYRRGNDFGLTVDYPRLIKAMIEMFLIHPDAPQVHLVGHVICPGRPVEDDMTALRALHEEYPDTHLAPAFQTPSEAKRYISGMSFFAGARMHSCIAAFSSGVAVLPMAYSRKFEGLFGALGYRHCVDMRAATNDDVLRMARTGFESRDAWTKDAQQSCEEGLERLRLYETALATLMLQVLRERKEPATALSAAGLQNRLSVE